MAKKQSESVTPRVRSKTSSVAVSTPSEGGQIYSVSIKAGATPSKYRIVKRSPTTGIYQLKSSKSRTAPKDTTFRSTWVDLLQRANHKDKKFLRSEAIRSVVYRRGDVRNVSIKYKKEKTYVVIWVSGPVSVGKLSDLQKRVAPFTSDAELKVVGEPTKHNEDPKQIQERREIIHRIIGWAGSKKAASLWYRSEPIPAFGGRTAEALVSDGKAEAVRDFLDNVVLGGFA